MSEGIFSPTFAYVRLAFCPFEKLLSYMTMTMAAGPWNNPLEGGRKRVRHEPVHAG